MEEDNKGIEELIRDALTQSGKPFTEQDVKNVTATYLEDDSTLFDDMAALLKKKFTLKDKMELKRGYNIPLSFKETLAIGESRQNQFKADTRNSESTAQGPFQITRTNHEDAVKKIYGADWNTFQKDADMQEKYMDILEKDYDRALPKFKKYAYAKDQKFTDEQIKAGIHYFGIGDAQTFFQSGTLPAERASRIKGFNQLSETFTNERKNFGAPKNLAGQYGLLPEQQEAIQHAQAVDISKIVESNNAAIAKGKATTELLTSKAAPKTKIQNYINDGIKVVSETEKAFQDVNQKEKDAQGGILSAVGNFVYDNLLRAQGPSGIVAATKRTVEKDIVTKRKFEEIKQEKAAIFDSLPSLPTPVDYKDIAEAELKSPEVSSVLAGGIPQPIVTAQSPEDAYNAATKRLNDHTKLMRETVDHFKSKLTVEEQQIADNLNNLAPDFFSSYKMSPEMEKFLQAQDNLNQQLKLNDQNVSKYTPLVEESMKAILNARQNGEDPKVAFNNIVGKYTADNPIDRAAIDKIKDQVNDFIDTSEPAVGVPVAEWLQETLYKVGGSLSAMGEGIAEPFKKFFRVASPDTRFSAAEFDALSADDAKRKIMDIVATNPKDAATADLVEDQVKVGNRIVVLKNGQPDHLKDAATGKVIYYQTKQDDQLLLEFAKDPKEYIKKNNLKKETDFRWDVLWNQGGQIGSDMLPMIAASAVTGGSTLGLMSGSALVSYGDYYEEARSQGKDITDASLYAGLTAGLIAIVESKIGKTEQLLGRALSGAEKNAIYNGIKEFSKKEASRGALKSTLERGYLQRAQDFMTAGVPIYKETGMEVVEEGSNFFVEAATQGALGLEVKKPTESDLINTFGLTIFTSTGMGLLGGGASMDKKNITDLVGLAVNNREGFKEISANWIQAAKDKKLGDAEVKRREDEVARKTKIINTVGEYYDYIKEESEGRKMKDEKKSEIMDLAEQKAMVDYEIDKATSQIRKDKLALKSQEIQKELDKLVYDGTDIATEEETAEEKKEAAPTTKKDTETKTQENAVQEQKTTEVPVQPKTESSGTDTQGQPQSKPEGTTQQGKTQEQAQGEEITNAEEFNDVEIISDYSETPVTYKGESGTLRKDGQTWTVETPTTIYDLGGVGDDTTLSAAGVQIADKITPNEDGSFSIRGKEFSNMFSDPMSAITLNEDGSYTVRLDTKGDNPKPRNFRGQLAEDLAYQITLQKITKEDAKGFEEYINNADANGEIPSPVSETKVGTDAEVPKAKKQRVRNTPQSTQTTEQGVPTTQGENVAPTQPQGAQKTNVLADFEVTTTKGTAAPRTYTKNSNGKWIAQTKKEDGTLSKGVPVSSANIVAQLDSESSKRAADNASQDVEAKKADIEKRRQEELDNSVGEGVTKNALKKANKPSKTKEQADSEIEKVKKENKELINKLEDPNTTEEEWDKLADELGEKFRGTSNTFWFDKKDGKIKFAYTSVGKNGRINTQYSNAEPDSVGEYEVGDLLQVSNGSTNLPAKVTKVSSTGRVLEAKTDDGTVVIRNGFVLDANQVQANRVINAKYDAELSALEQQPAAQTTTTKTKDKETTTTSTPIQEETLEEAVQRVDSTSIIQLDDIISRAEKDLENTTNKTKKKDIQQTIDSLKKTRDQLSNSQAKSQTKADENISTSKSESKTSEEGKMDTPLDKEQGKGREEGSTEEEVGEDEEAPSDKILGKKYARYIERALASPGISEEFKAALLEKAVPKVPISDEVTRSFAKAFVSELKTEKEMADAVEKLVNSFTAKINNLDKVTALATGVWEIEAIKQINKKLNDTFGEKTATDVFNRLSGIFSALGSALRLAGVADPATLAISNFSRHNTMEAHLFDAPTFDGSDVTHRQVAEDLIKIYDEAVQEQKDALKTKIAQDIKNQKIKDAAAPKTETKEATNEDAKSAKIDLVKRLNTKADEYLSRFRSRNTGFQSGLDIDALTDYALYLYYKTAGSIVKTKRMFESKFGKDVTNTNWDKITSSDEFNNATQDIAREKLLAAINKSGQPNEYTGTETSNRTPAQMVIQSIVRHLTKKEKRPAAAKSIKEIIDGKTLDIATVSDLRRDIASGLLDLEEDARAEMLNQVDDLLATLVKDKADTTANPWLKKTYIRSQVRESLAALEKTIDDLIDDVTNKDLITDTISTEFITRTGMTAEEAAPYIKIIQDNIESFINEKVKARAEKNLLDSYGRNLITLKEAVDIQKNVFESSKAMLDKKKVELNAALRDKTIPTEKIKELQQEVKDLQARAMESKKKMEAYQKRLASGKKMLEMKAKSKTFNKQPSIERIGEIVRNGGLSEETIRQPFAEALGARVFTQSDAEKLRQLYERLDKAAFAIDKKEAYDAISRFAFKIKSDVDRKIFVDLFESYMYANMLGSPKTAEVALGAGSYIFFFQEATSLGIQIAKDIADIFTKGDLDFKNTRIMADAAKNSWVNSKMSGQGFWDIASGKEGLTLTDLAEGTQGRVVNSLNNMDTLRGLRARALREGRTNAAKWYKLQMYHQVLSRGLIIADYVVSSIVLPYKLYRNLADQSRQELKDAGLLNPRYTEIIDKVQAKMKVDEVEQQLITEGFAKSKNAGEYNHRRAQILYEFLEDSDKQSLIQAEDAVRRLTMTGRVAGYSGRVIGEINKGFNTISNWGAKDGERNLTAMISASVSKLMLTPFTGMTFKVIQATKNYTPFGTFQPNRREGESGWQWFTDYNYYDVNKKTWQTVPASQHERETRWISATLPTIVGMYIFASAFDWEDDELVLAKDYPYFFTTGYSPAMAKKLAAQNVTYEPYNKYKTGPDGTIERIGPYRDYPFMWPLAVVGRLQEKLMFDQEEPMSSNPQEAPPPNDPLTGMEAFLAGTRSVLAYSTQGSLSNAGTGALAVLTSLEGGNVDGYNLKKLLASLTRQAIPMSALQADLDNYYSILQQEARKKGTSFIGDVTDKMLLTSHLVDNTEFDVLGEDVIQKPYGPPITTLFTRATEALAHWLKGEPELRYPDARKIFTKYKDIDKIKVFTFKPVEKQDFGQTVVEAPDDEQLTYDMKKEAANMKGTSLQESYEILDNMPKMDLEKELDSINQDVNEQVRVKYAVSVLDKYGYNHPAITKTKQLNDYMINTGIFINSEGKVVSKDYLGNYER